MQVHGQSPVNQTQQVLRAAVTQGGPRPSSSKKRADGVNYPNINTNSQMQHMDSSPQQKGTSYKSTTMPMNSLDKSGHMQAS